MKISIVVAMTRERVIGCQGKIPWRLPADLIHFRQLTVDHPVIMGHLTYQSIKERLKKPLPERKNIVLSRQTKNLPGCTVVPSWPEAVQAAGSAPEVFVIGGAQIYQLALPAADYIYQTLILKRFSGDVLFPPLEQSQWRLTGYRYCSQDDINPYPYVFLTYNRIYFSFQEQEAEAEHEKRKTG